MNVVVSHWSANVAVLVAYAVAAAAHLLGMRGAATGTGRPGRSRPASPVVEAVAFQAGLLLVLLALVSPVGYWSQRFIWVRNLQDVMLAIVAPALIVLGAPWLPLSRGLRLSGRLRWPAPGGPEPVSTGLASTGLASTEPAGIEPAGTGRTAGPAGGRNRERWQAWPVLIAVVFSALWWGWHLPVLFEAALRSPAVYAAEVVSYLLAGTLLWLQLAGSWPLRPRSGPVHRVALVVAVAASCTVLGIVQAFGSGLAYPAYRGFHHHDLSVIGDQQLGGAVLWVIALIPFSIAAVALLMRWLSDEESQSLATGFDRLLKPPKSAWPSRPGLR